MKSLTDPRSPMAAAAGRRLCVMVMLSVACVSVALIFTTVPSHVSKWDNSPPSLFLPPPPPSVADTVEPASTAEMPHPVKTVTTTMPPLTEPPFPSTVRRIAFTSIPTFTGEGTVSEGAIIPNSGAYAATGERPPEYMSRFGLAAFKPILHAGTGEEIGLRIERGGCAEMSPMPQPAGAHPSAANHSASAPYHGFHTSIVVSEGEVKEWMYPAYNPPSEYKKPPSPSSFNVSTYAPLLAPHCPTDRFVWPGTQFGRHHNQLQEIMGTIAWAERLDRTAIIGDFWDSGWHDVSEFYDFSTIRRLYCAVSFSEAKALLAARVKEGEQNPLSIGCVKNCDISGTRFRGIDGIEHGGNISLHRMPDFDSRYGTWQMQQYFRNLVMKSSEGLLMLGGLVSFYIRPGVWESARIFRHLRPNDAIETLINRELARPSFYNVSLLSDEGDNTNNAPHQRSARAAALDLTTTPQLRADYPSTPSRGFRVYPHFSFHTRSREGTCLYEVDWNTRDHGGYLAGMDIGGDGIGNATFDRLTAKKNLHAHRNSQGTYHPPTRAWHWAWTQCHYTTELVDRVLESAAPLVRGTKIFLASDGQNARFDDQMKRRNVVTAQATRGLSGVVVDFLLLTRGLYFSGNQISSFSQNVCMLRLGNGLTCDGWFPTWFLYHTRHALSSTIAPPPTKK